MCMFCIIHFLNFTAISQKMRDDKKLLLQKKAKISNKANNANYAN